MARSGQRQWYISGIVLVLVVSGIAAAVLRSAGHQPLQPTAETGVLGAQSGDTGPTGLRDTSAPDYTVPSTIATPQVTPVPSSRISARTPSSPPAVAAPPVTAGTSATQPTGGFGGSTDTDYKEHPPSESEHPTNPSPVVVPTPVEPYIIGRHTIEIPLGSTEPWTDSFKTSDDSPVVWSPEPGDPVYWENQSIGSPLSPAYLILSGDPGIAAVTLPYKVIVNDVVAQPGDTVVFTLHAAQMNQSIQLQVTITK